MIQQLERCRMRHLQARASAIPLALYIRNVISYLGWDTGCDLARE